MNDAESMSFKTIQGEGVIGKVLKKQLAIKLIMFQYKVDCGTLSCLLDQCQAQIVAAATYTCTITKKFEIEKVKETSKV